MEAKYYIPTIEEFHLGFEFEHLNFQGKLISNHPSNTAEWHKEICDADWFNILLDDYEHSSEEVNKYRVKYLDKEDIESLGWEISKIQRNPKTTCFEKSDTAFRFVLEIDIDSVKIDAYLDFKIPMFIGSVKNKSELKKLMQMLNIT